MIRDYKNKRIYTNLKVTKILSAVSFGLAIIAATAYTLSRYLLHPLGPVKYMFLFINSQILFYLWIFLIPLNIYITATRSLKQNVVKHGESKWYNDFANLLTPIVISFLPIILCIFPGGAYSFGYLLIPHSLAYVADGFLIYTCVLIKREWKDDPPDFVKEQKAKKEFAEKTRQAERERVEREQLLDQNNALYQSLIEKCGIKFLIKYYKQIERLPLRDVNVTENYPPDERNERLDAAKKIIDSGLSEFTLTKILNTYGDILNEAELDQARTLLEELQATHHEANKR